MDLSAFEIIYELPREITTEEVLGRRIFLKINSFVPKAQTIGEVADWTSYSVRLPKEIRISFANYTTNSIRYTMNHETNILTITVSQNASSLEARDFMQHIMNEVTKCQKKRSK